MVSPLRVSANELRRRSRRLLALVCLGLLAGSAGAANAASPMPADAFWQRLIDTLVTVKGSHTLHIGRPQVAGHWRVRWWHTQGDAPTVTLWRQVLGAEVRWVAMAPGVWHLVHGAQPTLAGRSAVLQGAEQAGRTEWTLSQWVAEPTVSRAWRQLEALATAPATGRVVSDWLIDQAGVVSRQRILIHPRRTAATWHADLGRAWRRQGWRGTAPEVSLPGPQRWRRANLERVSLTLPWAAGSALIITDRIVPGRQP